MKRILSLALLLLLSALPALAASTASEKPVINDKVDEINYSVGHQVGRDLQRQGVEVRSDILWQGIVDGATGDEALMSMDEMLDVLIGFRADIVDAYEEKKKGYRLRGQEYLAENETRPEVVTLESGLQYRVLVESDQDGDTPVDGDNVLVKFISRNIDGVVFSTSQRDGVDGPMELSMDKLIPGWNQALKMMKEGDKWELYVPSRLGFKDTGPMAGQTTVYEVELVEVLPRTYQ